MLYQNFHCKYASHQSRNKQTELTKTNVRFNEKLTYLKEKMNEAADIKFNFSEGTAMNSILATQKK